MTPPEPFADTQWAKLIASIAGSALSLRLLPGTRAEKLIMFAAGCVLALLSGDPLGEWIGAPKLSGLIGFVVAFFGITLLYKMYDVIQAMDTKAIAADLWARIKRFLGAS